VSEEEIMVRKRGFKCRHSKFLVDPQLAYVECGFCGEQLNPMWVVGQLCDREALANRKVRALEEVAKRAEAKNRCKCEKCGEMTRIQKYFTL